MLHKSTHQIMQYTDKMCSSNDFQLVNNKADEKSYRSTLKETYISKILNTGKQ